MITISSTRMQLLGTIRIAQTSFSQMASPAMGCSRSMRCVFVACALPSLSHSRIYSVTHPTPYYNYSLYIKQAPAVGRAVSELIVDGSFQTINLQRFGCDRLARGEKMLERNIV